MKVLYLTKYTEKAASSRMRSFQYFPYLEKAGFQVTVKPFFDEAYLSDFYAGKKNRLSVFNAYIRRFFVLFTLFRYDKVVIEKEIFPYFPAVAEWFLKQSGIKYIADYDDAIFHNYDLNPNPVIRFFLKKKIERVMKYSSVVVTGNSYLADYAQRAGAQQIEIIPTVIDLDRYSVKEKHEQEKPFVVGWIGTKSTFEKHLLPCKEWIVRAQKELDAEFHVVGIPEDQNLGANVKYFPWSKETEVSNIQQFDVGIMPLKDSPWEKGKCAYKLIQYAACGIPGIASDVGMNREVTVEGITGFLAGSNDEWIATMKCLKEDQQLRQKLGHNARKWVEEHFCIQATADKWIEIVNK